MKSFDTLSKRIFVMAVSISLVLLSASAFLMTIQRVTAAPAQGIQGVMPTFVGLGQIGNRAYYLQYVGMDYQVNSLDLTKDKKLPKAK